MKNYDQIYAFCIGSYNALPLGSKRNGFHAVLQALDAHAETELGDWLPAWMEENVRGVRLALALLNEEEVESDPADLVFINRLTAYLSVAEYAEMNVEGDHDDESTEA